jgi:hypothetical protein
MKRDTPLAIALGLALSAPAFAADPSAPGFGQEQLMTQIHALQHQAQQGRQGQWVNAWMPAATGAVQFGASADQLLQALVASYDRELLDRGAWQNPVFPDEHYAAAAPLLHTAVGSGVTTARIATPATGLTLALR